MLKNGKPIARRCARDSSGAPALPKAMKRQRNHEQPDPIKIENALRKIAKTWSNFLAFTILIGSAQVELIYGTILVVSTI